MRELSASDVLRHKSYLEGEEERVNFDRIRQQVKDLLWPDSGDFTVIRGRGQKQTERIYDSSAAQALEKGSAALEAYLTPRISRWHRLVASDEALNRDASVKRWLEDATDVLFRRRNAPRAGCYGQMHEVWKSILAYGDGCIHVDERPDGGTRYHHMHIGQMWIELNEYDEVDTIYREYELTAHQAKQRWAEKTPKSILECVEEHPYRKFKFVSCVYPSDDYRPGSKAMTEAKYASVDVACEDQIVVERGHHHEMPYIWTRYTVSPHEKYGRGPGMLILPEVQTLQEMEKVFMRSGHKVADPPLMAAHDGVLGRGSRQIRIGPGAVNVGALGPNGEELLKPLITGARLDITMEMAELKRKMIREAFLNDVHDLLVQPRVQMTATEVLERAREKGEFLTPLIGRQQSEMLGPMIHRELKIAIRAGEIDDLPDALKEAQGEYDIIYESAATRMQKSQEVQGLAQAIQVTMPWVQANPALLYAWKVPEMMVAVNEALGVPSKLVNTPDEYKRIEAEIQAKMQQEQDRAMVADDARAAKDLASVAQGRQAA
jgi:hypothetical protein